ncbi:hypothetical protein U1Q18_026799 [Sarracenia purpurea var. burkii]
MGFNSWSLLFVTLYSCSFGNAAGADGSSSNVSFGNKDGVLQLGRQSSLPESFGTVSEQFGDKSTSDYFSGAKDTCSDVGKLKLVENMTEDCLSDLSAQPDLRIKDLNIGVPYDICPVKTGNVVMLKAPLLVQNRIKRNEAKRSVEVKKIDVLRDGMILLKNYISFIDQVKIVKKCRDLGLGSGGFYEPGYRDGAKLHLKMMCLGKNWDPETSKYIDERPVDGAKPPLIPGEFCELVKGAIQDSHCFLREQCTMPSVEHVLPSMSPNICIVNFYTKSGRLGLHQDKDESPESLSRGLPVVSFSIGDSAEFLYSDQRDADRAEKVELKSGDVLIFGGRSRHIFHGVKTIIPETASKALLEETNLLPGRLNLTFREY